MTHASVQLGRWGALGVVLLLGGWAVPAGAQGPPKREGFRSPPTTQDAGRGGFRGRRMEHVMRGLFRIEPEDEGPLQPGEAEELLEFAREHAPRLHRAMTALRERSPERFAERMTTHAPRLRHLRRVWARNPRLGAIIQTYAENLIEIERGARALRKTPADSPTYERDLQALRDLIADNLRRESDALEALAEHLDAQRATRVAERVTQLTTAGADLSTEPEKVRDLVATYLAAAGDAERNAAREKLEAAVTHQLTTESAALRERAARQREHAPEEVDRRVEHALAPGPPGRPDQHPPHR